MLPPNPEKLLIPSNPNKSSRGNLYLYSSFVYKWLSFDEINEDILFNELNLLFEIYDKITENINMSSYYNMLEKIDLIDNISDNLLDGIIKKVDKVKSYNFNERKLIPIKGKTEKNNKKNIISRVQMQEALTKKTKIGNKAEEVVRDYEKHYLIENNKNNLAAKVKILDIDDAGYDVDSFYLNGDSKKIEVKGTSGTQNKIYISSNELNAVINDDVLLYFVKKVNTEEPEIFHVELNTDTEYNPIAYEIRLEYK